MTKQEQIKQKQNEVKRLQEEIAELQKSEFTVGAIKVARSSRSECFTIGIRNPYPPAKGDDITDINYKIRIGNTKEEMKRIADEIYKLLED